MKLSFIALLVLLGMGIGFWAGSSAFSPNGFSTLASSSAIQPFFCPNDSCDRQLIRQIESAKNSIDLAIYSFTLDSVSDALVAAKERGVLVRVLFDSSQAASEYSKDEKLQTAGVLVKRMNLPRGILHDKYIIIDHLLVGTGSYNYSENASKYNKENLVFISDSVVAADFEHDFESLWNSP